MDDYVREIHLASKLPALRKESLTHALTFKTCPITQTKSTSCIRIFNSDDESHSSHGSFPYSLLEHMGSGVSANDVKEMIEARSMMTSDETTDYDGDNQAESPRNIPRHIVNRLASSVRTCAANRARGRCATANGCDEMTLSTQLSALPTIEARIKAIAFVNANDATRTMMHTSQPLTPIACVIDQYCKLTRHVLPPSSLPENEIAELEFVGVRNNAPPLPSSFLAKEKARLIDIMMTLIDFGADVMANDALTVGRNFTSNNDHMTSFNVENFVSTTAAYSFLYPSIAYPLIFASDAGDVPLVKAILDVCSFFNDNRQKVVLLVALYRACQAHYGEVVDILATHIVNGLGKAPQQQQQRGKAQTKKGKSGRLKIHFQKGGTATFFPNSVEEFYRSFCLPSAIMSNSTSFMRLVFERHSRHKTTNSSTSSSQPDRQCENEVENTSSGDLPGNQNPHNSKSVVVVVGVDSRNVLGKLLKTPFKAFFGQTAKTLLMHACGSSPSTTNGVQFLINKIEAANIQVAPDELCKTSQNFPVMKALFEAVRGRNLKTMKTIFENEKYFGQMSQNAIDDASAHACIIGFFDGARYLLEEKGADPTVHTYFVPDVEGGDPVKLDVGEPILHHTKSPRIVKLLLDWRRKSASEKNCTEEADCIPTKDSTRGSGCGGGLDSASHVTKSMPDFVNPSQLTADSRHALDQLCISSLSRDGLPLTAHERDEILECARLLIPRMRRDVIERSNASHVALGRDIENGFLYKLASGSPSNRFLIEELLNRGFSTVSYALKSCTTDKKARKTLFHERIPLDVDGCRETAFASITSYYARTMMFGKLTSSRIDMEVSTDAEPLGDRVIDTELVDLFVKHGACRREPLVYLRYLLHTAIVNCDMVSLLQLLTAPSHKPLLAKSLMCFEDMSIQGHREWHADDTYGAVTLTADEVVAVYGGGSCATNPQTGKNTAIRNSDGEVGASPNNVRLSGHKRQRSLPASGNDTDIASFPSLNTEESANHQTSSFDPLSGTFECLHGHVADKFNSGKFASILNRMKCIGLGTRVVDSALLFAVRGLCTIAPNSSARIGCSGKINKCNSNQIAEMVRIIVEVGGADPNCEHVPYVHHSAFGFNGRWMPEDTFANPLHIALRAAHRLRGDSHPAPVVRTLLECGAYPAHKSIVFPSIAAVKAVDAAIAKEGKGGNLFDQTLWLDVAQMLVEATVLAKYSEEKSDDGQHRECENANNKRGEENLVVNPLRSDAIAAPQPNASSSAPSTTPIAKICIRLPFGSYRAIHPREMPDKSRVLTALSAQLIWAESAQLRIEKRDARRRKASAGTKVADSGEENHRLWYGGLPRPPPANATPRMPAMGTPNNEDGDTDDDANVDVSNEERRHDRSSNNNNDIDDDEIDEVDEDRGMEMLFGMLGGGGGGLPPAAMNALAAGNMRTYLAAIMGGDDAVDGRGDNVQTQVFQVNNCAKMSTFSRLNFIKRVKDLLRFIINCDWESRWWFPPTATGPVCISKKDGKRGESAKKVESVSTSSPSSSSRKSLWRHAYECVTVYEDTFRSSSVFRMLMQAGAPPCDIVSLLLAQRQNPNYNRWARRTTCEIVKEALACGSNPNGEDMYTHCDEDDYHYDDGNGDDAKASEGGEGFSDDDATVARTIRNELMERLDVKWPISPLHIAANNFRCPRLVRILLENGADPNFKDRKGLRPIDRVIARAREQHFSRHPRENEIPLIRLLDPHHPILEEIAKDQSKWQKTFNMFSKYGKGSGRNCFHFGREYDVRRLIRVSGRENERQLAVTRTQQHRTKSTILPSASQAEDMAELEQIHRGLNNEAIDFYYSSDGTHDDEESNLNLFDEAEDNFSDDYFDVDDGWLDDYDPFEGAGDPFEDDEDPFWMEEEDAHDYF